MLQEAITYIKGFFFPKFSIAEFITLFLLLLFWLFENFPTSGVFKLPNSTGDLFWLFIFLVTIVGGFVYIIYRVIQITWQKDQASLSDRKIISTIFYTFLSIVSLAAAIQTITIFKGSLSQIVELVFTGYIAIKSLVTMIILLLLNDYKSDNKSHIYAVQMDDQKLSHTEILILIVSTSAIYLLLKNTLASLPAIIVTYFYSTILLKLFRSFYKRIIFH